ncbi:MAG: transporter substrate-binding domain-containing protein [Pseudomonadota bacterium]
MKNDRPSIRYFAAMLVLTTLLAPAVWAQNTLERVKSRSMLVVGYLDNASPFSFANGGKALGYSIDLCAPIIERIAIASGAKDLRVVYQSVELGRAVNLLRNGAIDLMCANLSDTPERRKLVAFSPPVYFAAVRLLVRSSDKLGSVQQLAGKNLVQLGGSTARRALDAYAAANGLKWQVANMLEHDAAMSQLQLGQADGYARDDIVLSNALRALKDPAQFTLLPERLSSEPIAIAYRKADPAMQKLVDLSIVEAMRGGQFAEVYEKWFTRPIPPENRALDLPMSRELRSLLAAAR